MGTSRKAKYLEYPRTQGNYKIRDNIIGRNILITMSYFSSSPSHHDLWGNPLCRWRGILMFSSFDKSFAPTISSFNKYLVGPRRYENMIGNWPTDQVVTSSIKGNKRWVASAWWSKPTSVARDPPVVVEIHSSTSSRPVATRQQRLEHPTNSSRERLECSQAQNMNKELFQ